MRLQMLLLQSSTHQINIETEYKHPEISKYLLFFKLKRYCYSTSGVRNCGAIVLYLPYVNCYSTSEVWDCGAIVSYSSYVNYYSTSGVQDHGSNSFIQ